MPDYRPPIDLARQRARRRRNAIHTVLLLAGMALLMALCGWVVAGPAGLVWIGLLGGFGLIATSRVSPRLVLRMFRAEPLSRRDLPEVYEVVEVLSRRAMLPKPPALYFLSSRISNAFSVGTRDNAGLVITSGALRLLNLRELSGVLAHEISHLANNDTRVMGLADVASRLTRAMSLTGLLLLLLNLPLMTKGGAPVSWVLVLLLIFAPTVGTLLQLALSRAREFDADLEAARLTGDPDGLASALAKFERHQGSFWEDILMPGRRNPDPSILRTHPQTDERIRRLRELRVPQVPPLRLPPDLTRHHGSVPTVLRGPRWQGPGLWY